VELQTLLDLAETQAALVQVVLELLMAVRELVLLVALVRFV
jgi:hypothetical protein